MRAGTVPAVFRTKTAVWTNLLKARVWVPPHNKHQNVIFIIKAFESVFAYDICHVDYYVCVGKTKNKTDTAT